MTLRITYPEFKVSGPGGPNSNVNTYYSGKVVKMNKKAYFIFYIPVCQPMYSSVPSLVRTFFSLEESVEWIGDKNGYFILEGFSKSNQL